MKKICFFLLTTLLASQAFAQNTKDTTGQFHDDLLDHLVGKWDATSIVHENPFTIKFDVQWVLNHQYLHIHFKSNEVVPWLNIPFESDMFLGYSHIGKHYT